MGIGLGSWLAQLIPLWLYRSVVRRPVLGLNYHLITDEPAPHCPDAYEPKDSRSFEADLIELKRKFIPISYERLAEAVSTGRPLPPRAVVVTADDGYSECHEIMRPLLLKHEIPCIFFIATGFLDNQSLFFKCKLALCLSKLQEMQPQERERKMAEVGMMAPRSLANYSFRDLELVDALCEQLEVDWRGFLRARQPFLTREQVQCLHQEGFRIGAHTCSHPDLRLMEEPEIESEVLASVRQIVDLTGATEVPFAFPWSGKGLSRDFLSKLRREHLQLGLFFDTQGLQVDVPFVIQRITADEVSCRRGSPSVVRLVKRSYFNYGLHCLQAHGPFGVLTHSASSTRKT